MVGSYRIGEETSRVSHGRIWVRTVDGATVGAQVYAKPNTGELTNAPTAGKDVAHNGSPDPGWLKCVGSVLIRTAYPKLFAAIGTTYNTGGETSLEFRLPDWRGLFTRCLDDGRGMDTGRVMNGAPQASQNLAHSHSASTNSAGSHTHTLNLLRDRAGVVDERNAVYGDENYFGSDNKVTSSSGSHTHTVSVSSSGGTEARSVNLTQVRWIRYL